MKHRYLFIILLFCLLLPTEKTEAQISTTLYGGPNNNGTSVIEICVSVTNRDTADWTFEQGLEQIIVVQFGDAPINGDNTANASCLLATGFNVTSGSVDSSILNSSVSTARSDNVDFEVAFEFRNDLVLRPGESLELFCGQNSQISGSCEDLVFLLDCSGTQFTIYNDGALMPTGTEDCTQGFAQQCNPNRPDAFTIRLEKEDASCPDINDGLIVSVIEGSPTNLKYEWSTGDTIEILSGLAPGSYSLTVTDEEGCFEIDEVDIQSGIPIDIVFDVVPSCPGFSNGSAIANVTNGREPYIYNWSPTVLNSNEEFAQQLESGSYGLTVTDSNGCSVTEVVEIGAINSHDILLSCINPSNTSVQIEWTTDASINDYEVNIDNQGWIAPTGSFTHRVNDLQEEQLVNIQVRGIRDCTPLPIGEIDCLAFEFDKDNSLSVANIFSPNGDNVNDILIADGRPGVVINEFSIYDRWGNQVFYSENFAAGDSNFGWDGTDNGSMSAIGVYIYRVMSLLPNGEVITIAGDVTLVR